MPKQTIINSCGECKHSDQRLIDFAWECNHPDGPDQIDPATIHEKCPLNDTINTSEITDIVNKQAEDNGLWFIAETVTEAYLQKELRKLHAVIEGVLVDVK